jgi:hypothetical protein
VQQFEVPDKCRAGVRACAIRAGAADASPRVGGMALTLVGPRRPLVAQDRYRRAQPEPQPVAGHEPCHTWAWIASAHLIGLRRLDPVRHHPFILRGKSGTPEVAMSLALVIILAALFIAVTMSLVIVQRRPWARPKGAPRRTHLPVGDEATHRHHR